MSQNEEHNNEGDPNFFSDNEKQKSFHVPEDYFMSFEKKIKARLAINDEMERELSDFPLLQSIPKNTSFIVPKNYFLSKHQALELEFEKEQYKALYAFQQQSGFIEPNSGYVNTLLTSLTHKIEVADELKTFKTLYHINKSNPFVIQESYFDSLASKIKGKIYASNQSSYTIWDSILDFIFARKLWLSFSLLMVVTLSIYFYKSNNIADQSGDCKTLACLERQEILNNKAITNFDEEQLIDLVDVNSLDKQLNSKIEDAKELSKDIKEDSLIDEVNMDDLTEAL